MATNIQRSQMAGRLTKKPELKQSGSDIICCFTIAVNLGSGENRFTEFNECVARGKTAENIARYFDKGDEIEVFCNKGWRTREWTDRDGGKHFKMEHRVSDFNFIGNKSAPTAQVPTESAQTSKNAFYAAPTPIPAPQFEAASSDEDLPF